jgi:hypothetical protein
MAELDVGPLDDAVIVEGVVAGWEQESGLLARGVQVVQADCTLHGCQASSSGYRRAGRCRRKEWVPWNSSWCPACVDTSHQNRTLPLALADRSMMIASVRTAPPVSPRSLVRAEFPVLVLLVLFLPCRMQPHARLQQCLMDCMHGTDAGAGWTPGSA